MKNVVLMGLNARYTHSSLALYCLQTAAAGFPHRVKIAEFSINDTDDAVLSFLGRERPDVLGVGIYIWNAERVRSLVPRIGSLLPWTLIVAGGPEVSQDTEAWSREFPDMIIVKGPGETAFRELAEKDFSSKERIISRLSPEFSLLPFPYREEDFTGLKGKYIYYESSRGCAFRCSYCLSSRRELVLEFRDMALVKRELRWLAARGPRLVKFVDRTFNARPERAREIWQYLIENFSDSGTRFHFEIFPELLEEADFGLLRTCPPGLFNFEMGIQSVDSNVLEAVQRPGNWGKARENILRLTAEGSIHSHVDLIAGLPLENEASFREGFNGIYGLGADHVQLGFLKVLPGTRIREEAARYGIVHGGEPPYEVLSTPGLSEQLIARLKAMARLLDVLYNTGRFAVTLNESIASWSSSYDFYHDLAGFLEERSGSSVTKGWAENERLLHDFIVSRVPGKTGFFQDCLAWDWCASRAYLNYPGYHRSASFLERKKYWKRKFLAGKAGDRAVIGGHSLDREDLGRAVVFEPGTEVFRECHMKESRAALFLPSRKEPIFFMDWPVFEPS